ncbi:MAG TPA: hypothetical protein VGN81_12855 [Pseudonocardiaceae bacterium]|jgi:hypothetical protein
MSEHRPISRRRLLVSGLGAAGGVLLASGLAQPAFAAAWTSNTTANDWPVIAAPKPLEIEGTNLAVALLPGDVATVLLHCARRFCYEIDDTLTQTDVSGYSANRSVGAPFESNYLSGTAFALRPNFYPLGVQNGFFPRDVVIIRDILADCEGVVRWGGDLNPAKESHFQIDVPPNNATLAAVANKITRWQQLPGQGAGSATDPFSPDRLRAARALQTQQSRH